MSARLLVVDDEPSMLDMLSLLWRAEGYEVETARSVGEARERLAERPVDLVLCDILMPDGNGLELLREIKASDPRVAVIMMTAYTSTKSALEAMKLGAYDYISKPFADLEELKLLVAKALEKTQLVDENVYLRGELERRYAFDRIVGRSPRMRAVFELVERVARTHSTVLIQGESGTGKELVARAIHFASPRARQRFLSVNCGALPETLLESELFGHERGAFTGAVREKRGLFQEANRGTLFLDEIGDMSLPMQVKLLRALQDRTVRKVGGTVEEPVDVRIIAATNQNLAERLAQGTFREDLFYRINVIPIELPPLRERREDIPLLVHHFLLESSRRLGIEPRRISVEAMRRLETHSWPGNVRELENLVERTLALSTAEVITTDDLPLELLIPGQTGAATPTLPSEGLDLEAHLDGLRRELMRQALDRTGGHQGQAAELLGMSLRSFRYYAGKCGLAGRRDDEEAAATPPTAEP
ncbi:MAG: sigma-54-dependent Fis family transcriptional regulator [Acidobacteria bacterium]|nr:sigma-54-dependent Fis family transcriptional regulator [Thermoanaerobaculia bacterium]MDI9632128.1 sigma-54 dependent transcriptional regulator [Acidobacteriota bacterium]MBP7812844.1 sigma-54-dependent Fis family transcriptional regulator [Thermoanaerobaculia bacterium]MBP8844690.1 sigma-54-dependent Fis family transcriptional regulator [Thermoanaerobaculia bacterium]NLN11575.1 sigma-54-dependent Fis family transcriptional regulator [Acidobacteriota bacterium]